MCMVVEREFEVGQVVRFVSMWTDGEMRCNYDVIEARVTGFGVACDIAGRNPVPVVELEDSNGYDMGLPPGYLRLLLTAEGVGRWDHLFPQRKPDICEGDLVRFSYRVVGGDCGTMDGYVCSVSGDEVLLYDIVDGYSVKCSKEELLEAQVGDSSRISLN